MGELVDFLRARLDEDLRVTFNPALMPVTGPGLSGLVKRARCEVEAKRQIIDLHEEPEDREARHGHWEGHGSDEHWVRDEPNECPECGQAEPCRTLRLLALPYADHPDYRQDWALASA